MYSKFKVSFEHNNELVAGFTRFAGLGKSGKDPVELYSPAWPNMVGREMTRNAYLAMSSQWKPELRGTDPGRVSVGCPAVNFVLMSDFAALEWSQPVTVHWFYKRFVILPRMKNMREEECLRAVARCVGGRFLKKLPTKNEP